MIEIKDRINVYNDFPNPGVGFCDIGPLLADTVMWNRAMSIMSGIVAEWNPTHVLGLDARGFMIGISVAERLSLPLVMARKPGKLPGELVTVHYDLEYGSASLSIQSGAIPPGSNVVILDDILATGGTMSAAMELVQKMDSNIAGLATLIRIRLLMGRIVLEEAYQRLYPMDFIVPRIRWMVDV